MNLTLTLTSSLKSDASDPNPNPSVLSSNSPDPNPNEHLRDAPIDATLGALLLVGELGRSPDLLRWLGSG